jgi:hypothetical protein
VRDQLEGKVVLSPVVRILLALVVATGGLAFCVIGAILLLWKPPTPAPHSIAAALFLIGMVALGAGFLWIGIRLARLRSDSENLLSPKVRRRCSLIVGGLGACVFVGAFEWDNVWFFAGAVATVLFSYWLFPLESP